VTSTNLQCPVAFVLGASAGTCKFFHASRNEIAWGSFVFTALRRDLTRI